MVVLQHQPVFAETVILDVKQPVFNFPMAAQLGQRVRGGEKGVLRKSLDRQRVYCIVALREGCCPAIPSC